MAVKSTINLHKDFDLKVREFVGKEMHTKFLTLGIGIGHIKKIRIRIKQKYGLLNSQIFKKVFLEICGKLIFFLEKINLSSKRYVKKVISNIFAGKELMA